MVISHKDNMTALKEIQKNEMKEFRINIFYAAIVYLILFVVITVAFIHNMNYFAFEICVATVIYSIFIILHLCLKVRFTIENKHMCRVVKKIAHIQFCDNHGNTYDEPRIGCKNRSYYVVEFKDRDDEGNRINRVLECTKDQYERLVEGNNILVADIYRKKEKEYSVIGVIPTI